MIISTMHHPHEKEVRHLSRDRHITLCGQDCGNFVYVSKIEETAFVPTDDICTKCVEKLS